jgi:lipoprotein-anchoring transpeptidase ErfK/SrfK
MQAPTVPTHEQTQYRTGRLASAWRWLALASGLTLSACAQTPAVDGAATGPKRVVVDKTVQELIAYEGERVVLRTRVSTGRMGRRTPSGNFTVGVKERMHYSRLYDNAPMPFSVQISGNYFIHGFKYVPDRPASHGCIRVPLDGGNPAKQFYDWVEPGTPVEVTGDWVPPAPTKKSKR